MIADLAWRVHQLAAWADPPSPSGGPVPNITPSQNAPGADALTQVVGALMTYGLLGGFAGGVISLIVFGLGRWIGNPMAAIVGRVGMFAALAVFVLIGAAPALANWAFNLGASISVG
ncbi:hypothetical protein GCM10010411_76010 [Actinomadura fulvescens]|uniref:Integral membrane protein n=1 Tax=Actinomadura fulvescens TaxID=46160 RepID=A0ABP6CYQ3_9ACTN